MEIENYPEYEAVMAPSGIYNADGSELGTATLWDSTMVNRWETRPANPYFYLYGRIWLAIES